MLYLIGVDHSVQHDGPVIHEVSSQFEMLRDAFPDFLDRVAREIGANVIAEEFNEDALKKSEVKMSVACTLASKRDIKHVFCEPSISERKQLGITSQKRKEDFPKREAFWLKKLAPLKGEKILFILGACHVHSFSERAKKAGFSVNVAEEYYGKEFFSGQQSNPIDRLCR